MAKKDEIKPDEIKPNEDQGVRLAADIQVQLNEIYLRGVRIENMVTQLIQRK